MNGVRIEDGDFKFSLSFIYELAVLSKGPEEARLALRKMAILEHEPFYREAILEMCRTPVIIATSQEEKYERLYALIRELGRAAGRELTKNPQAGRDDSLYGVFLRGFGSGIFTDDFAHTSIADMFYRCGRVAARMTESLYPDDEFFPAPSLDEIQAAFKRGVKDEFSVSP